MRKNIGAVITGIFLAVSAMAAPVETSLRPQARPAAQGGVEIAGLRPVVMVSLRPMARPTGLAPPPEQGDLLPAASRDPAFQRWIDGFRGRALAAGVTARVFDRSFRNVGYNADVIAKDRNQSEFTRYIWDYLDNMTSSERVRNGQKALRQQGRTLARIEKTYGVEKEIITAIWGVESRYGQRRGTIPTIEALATLAYDGRRGKFFEAQLVEALKIIQSGDVAPRKMTGSWAGAMGHTQFIPTSYQAYAVDFTGDGKRDIWSDNPADALASTAAYLKRFGWKKGQPWGVEVRLPKGFSTSQAKRDLRRMPSDWAARGVLGVNGKPVPNYGRASILLPAGPEGAAFMIFDNFKVIERYNHADAYVIGVGHLSDRIKGGAPIQASWPRGYDPLNFEERKELQRRLRSKGYDLEKIDGIIGPNTVNAIRAYQTSAGVAPDGYPSQDVLKLLRGR